MNTPHPSPHTPSADPVPFWHYESDLRQRIKGRYIRRICVVLAVVNVVLIINLVA